MYYECKIWGINIKFKSYNYLMISCQFINVLMQVYY